MSQRKPAISMKVVDDELMVGSVSHRHDAVSDIDLAIHRLLNGELVHVFQFGPLVSGIQKTLAMTLKGKA